jgi:hypothetical protein
MKVLPARVIFRIRIFKRIFLFWISRHRHRLTDIFSLELRNTSSLLTGLQFGPLLLTNPIHHTNKSRSFPCFPADYFARNGFKVYASELFQVIPSRQMLSTTGRAMRSLRRCAAIMAVLPVHDSSTIYRTKPVAVVVIPFLTAIS